MTSRPYLFCSKTDRTEYFRWMFDLFQCNTLPIKGSKMKGTQKEQRLAAFVKTPHVFFYDNVDSIKERKAKRLSSQR